MYRHYFSTQSSIHVIPYDIAWQRDRPKQTECLFPLAPGIFRTFGLSVDLDMIQLNYYGLENPGCLLYVTVRK